jgi:hypothetical protein
MRFPSPLRFAAALYRVARALLRGESIAAPEWMIRARRRTCVSQAGVCYKPRIDQCQECTCFVSLKSALLTEDCPRKLW